MQPQILRATLLSVLILIGIGLRAQSTATAQTMDRSRLVSELDSAAAAHASDSTVAGVSVAVAQGGEMLLHEGYGQANLEFDVPTPRDAVYEVGSITKQFTAAAVLQLAGQDSLDLDAPITEYLPDYNTRGHQVTVRHLLHHTSGIRSYTNLSQFRTLLKQDLPRDTLLSIVGAEPFRFAPGSAMSYSNTGYFLLGLIIEEASGQSYADYLEANLLTPAGMESSHYCDEQDVVEHGAQGYSWSNEGGLTRREQLSHSWPYSAGSLCSTSGDLLAWNRALHGGEVLPDSIYQKMVAPGKLSDGTELRYGMGLGLYQSGGRRVIGHGGAINGFLSEARYYPEEDVAVVVLQNTAGPKPPAALADSLTSLALGPGEEPDPSTYEGDLSRLTGRYSGPARGRTLTMEVTVEEGRLMAKEVGSDEERPLEYVSSLTWQNETDRYTFIRDEGQTTELRLEEGYGHYVLRRTGDL